MFVCYQTSIERQFEYIQTQRERPQFCRRQGASRSGAGGHTGVRPDHRAGTRQRPPRDGRAYPNYPAGNRRTTLVMPDQFVFLTAADTSLYRRLPRFARC